MWDATKGVYKEAKVASLEVAAGAPAAPIASAAPAAAVEEVKQTKRGKVPKSNAA